MPPLAAPPPVLPPLDDPPELDEPPSDAPSPEGAPPPEDPPDEPPPDGPPDELDEPLEPPPLGDELPDELLDPELLPGGIDAEGLDGVVGILADGQPAKIGRIAATAIRPLIALPLTLMPPSIPSLALPNVLVQIST